jgi:hypothetical protein
VKKKYLCLIGLSIIIILSCTKSGKTQSNKATKKRLKTGKITKKSAFIWKKKVALEKFEMLAEGIRNNFGGKPGLKSILKKFFSKFPAVCKLNGKFDSYDIDIEVDDISHRQGILIYAYPKTENDSDGYEASCPTPFSLSGCYITLERSNGAMYKFKAQKLPFDIYSQDPKGSHQNYNHIKSGHIIFSITNKTESSCDDRSTHDQYSASTYSNKIFCYTNKKFVKLISTKSESYSGPRGITNEDIHEKWINLKGVDYLILTREYKHEHGTQNDERNREPESWKEYITVYKLSKNCKKLVKLDLNEIDKLKKANPDSKIPEKNKLIIDKY